MVRFNATNGELISAVKVEKAGGWASLTEDGSALFFVNTRKGKSRSIPVRSLNIADGKLSELGKLPFEVGYGQMAGLIPGGRHFYVAEPGIVIFDRRTLESVAEKPLRARDILDVHFADDGCRYAVFTRQWAEDRKTGQRRPRELGTIRIHDALSGRTLFAFQTRAPNRAKVRFSPDGRSVAVASAEDIIELWPLPNLPD